MLQKVQAGQDLTEPQAQELISGIMEGKLPPEEVKQILLALREKGEALPEVVGAARAMRAHAVPLEKPQGRVVVDTCGTGGDGLKTVNVSTLAALVAAGAGVPVAKHGNRSITSACGSADLLEALGVKVDAEPAVVERCLREANFGFLFAPKFHPAMKAVAPIRKALGVPTIFNLLGPLTNPAGVAHQVVGVADSSKMALYAEALKRLGSLRALVVHGRDGQDEISTTGATEIAEIHVKKNPKGVARYTLEPEGLGLARGTLAGLRGGQAQENARISQAVLAGESSAVRDAVLLNAAGALYVSGAAGDLAAGISFARESLDKGAAAGVLKKVVKLSHVEA